MHDTEAHKKPVRVLAALVWQFDYWNLLGIRV